MMTGEQDRVWSREVAELAVDGLVTAKIVSQADFGELWELCRRKFTPGWQSTTGPRING
jgi:hypothetical protein